MTRIHWVARGTGTPKDKDEVKRDVCEWDGWVCVLEKYTHIMCSWKIYMFLMSFIICLFFHYVVNLFREANFFFWPEGGHTPKSIEYNRTCSKLMFVTDRIPGFHELWSDFGNLRCVCQSCGVVWVDLDSRRLLFNTMERYFRIFGPVQALLTFQTPEGREKKESHVFLDRQSTAHICST